MSTASSTSPTSAPPRSRRRPSPPGCARARRCAGSTAPPSPSPGRRRSTERQEPQVARVEGRRSTVEIWQPASLSEAGCYNFLPKVASRCNAPTFDLRPFDLRLVGKAPMKITLRYFASWREELGREEEAREVAPGTTVGALIADVTAASPRLAALRPSTMFMVNQEYAP